MKNSKKLKELKFDLPVEIFKGSKEYIAYTPALDFAVQGRTKKEARELFVSGVVVFFEELARLGTTEEVLLDLGWKKVHSQWQPTPVFSEILPVKVQVPVVA